MLKGLMKIHKCPTALRHKSSETRGPTQTPTFWQWLQWLRSLCQTQQVASLRNKHLMDHNQHRNRRFEPLHVHHLKSLTSEHSTLLQRSWPRRSSRSQHSMSLMTSTMMRFSNKHLISSQQSCFSNKRLTELNKHQEAASTTKRLIASNENCFSNKRLTAATTTWRKNLQHCEV